MRSIPLSRRLIVVALAGVVPLAFMAALGLYELMNQQRAQAERAGIEISRALVTGVDAELGRSVSVLEAMAASPFIDGADLHAFDDLARRIVGTRVNWQRVILADAAGRPLLNTEASLDAASPETGEDSSFELMTRLRKPVVGRLIEGERGDFFFAVRVPILRDGAVRYVLSALVKPENVLAVVQRQRLPADWVVSVFDATGIRVARSRQHEKFLGTRASPSLAVLMTEKGLEGAGMTHALEGERIYTAFSRGSEYGWSVAIGLPPSYVEAGEKRSLAVLGGGIGFSLLLGGGLALLAARRINQPMRQLSAAAQALGHGARPVPPATNIEEIRDVGEALVAADAARAAAESDREELLRREQEARGVAEAANRAKDEFLAMLGHELRNPIGAISNATRLLEHPGTHPDAAVQARQIIARQVDHLARMTDDLLDAGRAILGKIALHRKPVDLAATVANTLTTLSERTQAHRIETTLEPTWVDGDPTRLEQIVTNLVVNAIKYTPPDGTIHIAVRKEGQHAVLRVVDDGIGMPADLTNKAFELFVQGDRDLDRAHGGLGIGLTLVRRLADLHGGSAIATSPGPGLGSEFVVRLPAIAGPAQGARRDELPARARSCDILIVEDNDDARESLRALLELAGHRVRTAPDGAAGLDAALAAPPDAALIDIGLPRMDGYEVARRIRAAPSGTKRPILIALTGYGLPEDRYRTAQAGFDAHLVKPIDPAALERLLKELG